MKCPEVITIDNSDDDDSDELNSVSRNVGATASIIRAKPLSFSALQPRVGFWRGKLEKTYLKNILHKYWFFRNNLDE